MTIYLPVAGMAVNIAWIVALGGLVGLLSGLFGVGGGFLTTPLLIVTGIPPAVAVASSATQITGSSVSGALAQWRRGGIDLKMGLVMTAGGALGALAGSLIFRWLQGIGQIDLAIGLLYSLLLGSIGSLMLRDALLTLGWVGRRETTPRLQRTPGLAMLPGRTHFPDSGLLLSPLAPLGIGFVAGILTMLLGVGGGFLLVPAMIYVLGMPARVVVGTSLLMILMVSAVTTLVHAVTTGSVDLVLAALLLIGGTLGAQLGTRWAGRIQPDLLRLALAALILSVALRMAAGLFWRPDAIFTLVPA
jgi:uncharacterized membrane protein YfcA